MTMQEVNNRYFEWMCGIVDQGRGRRSYRKLLGKLHETDFTYTVDLDGNRADDGIELRYRFGYDNHIPQPIIADCLDDRPCSILEMMVALSLRCEEHIMGDPDIGDRTARWFWDMIDNLGLGDMSDSRYDDEYICRVVDKFLDRRYKRDGSGGLFRVNNYRRDMRGVEIWNQMMWYLNENTTG